MDKIEKGLHAHHAAMASDSSTAASQRATNQGASVPTRTDRPFAKVNTIVANSPAETAGLKVGDRVTRFGTATWANNEKLAKVAEIVSQNEGVSCPKRISR